MARHTRRRHRSKDQALSAAFPCDKPQEEEIILHRHVCCAQSGRKNGEHRRVQE